MEGLQQVYREGLARLDERARARYGVSFAQATPADRDALLDDESDSELQAFVAAALANTFEAMYGPPEYGGNRDLLGWSSNGWAGDRQPARLLAPAGLKARSRHAAGRAGAAARAAGPLPGLSGRPAARDAPWLRRGRLGRP